jgi:hypothetical protein
MTGPQPATEAMAEVTSALDVAITGSRKLRAEGVAAVELAQITSVDFATWPPHALAAAVAVAVQRLADTPPPGEVIAAARATLVEEILVAAEQCRNCGRAHQFRPGVNTPYGSWADPGDGHFYHRVAVLPWETAELIRRVAAGGTP